MGYFAQLAHFLHNYSTVWIQDVLSFQIVKSKATAVFLHTNTALNDLSLEAFSCQLNLLTGTILYLSCLSLNPDHGLRLHTISKLDSAAATDYLQKVKLFGIAK